MKEVVVFTALVTAVLLTCTHGTPWVARRLFKDENGQPGEIPIWFQGVIYLILFFIGEALTFTDFTLPD